MSCHVGARSAGGASAATRSARAATRAWIRSASRSRTSTAIGKWRDDRGGIARSMRPARCPTAHTFDGPAAFRSVLLVKRPGCRRDTVTEKLLTYALGRGRRVLRHAGRSARSCETRRESDYRWSSLDAGHRPEHAVSDEAEWVSSAEHVMIITKKALSRRTFLRGFGATLALAAARRHDSGVRPTRRTAAPASPPPRHRLCAERDEHATVDAADGWGRVRVSPILEPLAPFRDQHARAERLVPQGSRRGSRRGRWRPLARAGSVPDGRPRQEDAGPISRPACRSIRSSRRSSAKRRSWPRWNSRSKPTTWSAPATSA